MGYQRERLYPLTPTPSGAVRGVTLPYLVGNIPTTMAIDFATSTGGSNDDNQSDDDVSEVDFEPNETAGTYITGGSEYTETLNKMRGTTGLEWPSMKSNPSMEDYSELRSRHEDVHILNRLTVLAVCAKGEVGEEQNHVNDHSIAEYKEAYPELPEVTWSGLTDDEKEELRNEGIDLEELGFDDDFEGPKLLEIDGERLPLGLEEGDVEKAERIFGKLPTEPSAHTEDGFRESSDPSVFDPEADTDKVEGGDDEGGEAEAEDDEDDDEPELDLSENPGAVTEANALYVRSAVTDIASEEALREMRRVEQNNDQRSSVIGRIDERLQASDVGGAEADDEGGDLIDVNLAENPGMIGRLTLEELQVHIGDITSTRTLKTLQEEEVHGKDRVGAHKQINSRLEEVEGSDESDESDDEAPTLDEVVDAYDLSEMETDAVQFRVDNDKASDYGEAARQVTS